MRISNKKLFKRRVLVPLSIPIYALTAYVGIFANIFFYQYPITMFVCIALSGVAISLTNYNTKEVTEWK